MRSDDPIFLASPPGRDLPDAAGTSPGALQSPGEVIRAYTPFITRTLRRRNVPAEEVADLVQDVLLIVAQGLPRFVPHESLSRADALRVWIFSICVRCAGARNRALRKRRQAVPFHDVVNVLPSERPRADELLERHEEGDLLQRLIAALSPERRAVLLAFDVEDRSIAEIAGSLDIPVATLWTRRRLALRDMKAAVARLNARDRRRAAPLCVPFFSERRPFVEASWPRAKIAGAAALILAAAVTAVLGPDGVSGGLPSLTAARDAEIATLIVAERAPSAETETRSRAPTPAMEAPEEASPLPPEVLTGRSISASAPPAASGPVRGAGATWKALPAHLPSSAGASRPDLARRILHNHQSR